MTQCADFAGVDMSEVIYKENSEIGTFFVLPEEKKVHYQRAHSAWALQEKDEFDWNRFLSKPNAWLHITGISPLTGATPAVDIYLFLLTLLVQLDQGHRSSPRIKCPNKYGSQS